mmetsp:Transcript_32744/g.71486  ORF Transcript_32744/g.71486 Transcript_32744/m.71486 type:complete len:786 (-) Transcript_32744:119-2476(-)
MRPLFAADGCAVDAAGISQAGNPLSRMLDAATGDALHAHQMREGFAAGMRPPMGMGPGMMLDPMMRQKPGSSMDRAWAEVGPARPMGPMGPALGAAMQDQLMRHMAPGAEHHEPGFFAEGPMSMRPPGADWAAEFNGPQAGPRGLQMPGPMRPMGPDWAAEFAGPRPQMPPAAMEAAFQQARMAGQMQGNMAEMEAAFKMNAGQSMSSTGPAMMTNGMPNGMAMMPPPMAMMGPRVRPPDMMDAAFREAQMEAAFAEAQQQSASAPAAEVGDQADLGHAAQMVEMLRNSGNPKFANSQFVDFIDKVSKGDLQFTDNTVIDREGNQVDWDSLYDTAAATSGEELEKLWAASSGQKMNGLEGAWRQAASSSSSAGPMEVLEKAWQAGEAKMEDAWKAAEPKLEDAWKAAASGVEDGDLEQLWKQAGGLEAMQDAWRLAGEEGEAALMEQAWMNEEMGMEHIWGQSGAKASEYQFQEDNKYLDSDDPLALAQQLLREGRDREALMALEAEVQRNPESSEGWRQLGQLYAELDQDVEAIQCLRRGHEVDPYNLDSLLALGVSCTNELDQLPALRYLRMWIESHEEHQKFVDGLEPPPEYEYEAWRRQVTDLFNQAAQANPLDANVFVALGVMENINRNYEGAILALTTACRLRPNDHTVWNKLGATLANSGKSEQAVVAYHQGLQLKPNYARSWSNLAIAHANLGHHQDAARFYLSSLVLNPEATHIWNFLHSAVLNLNNVNAFEAIDQRDLAACTKLIDGVLDPVTLPKPTQELPQPPDEILASIGLI